jgi:hypothetical protein
MTSRENLRKMIQSLIATLASMMASVNAITCLHNKTKIHKLQLHNGTKLSRNMIQLSRSHQTILTSLCIDHWHTMISRDNWVPRHIIIQSKICNVLLMRIRKMPSIFTGWAWPSLLTSNIKKVWTLSSKL